MKCILWSVIDVDSDGDSDYNLNVENGDEGVEREAIREVPKSVFLLFQEVSGSDLLDEEAD